MTVLEQRFMETLPHLLRELIEEIKGLREDIKELKKRINYGKHR